MNPLAGTPTSRLVCRWRPATVSLLLATCGLGRVQAAGGMVACPVGDETVHAYLARPADTGPPSQGSGIVVVHHFWGLDSHTQRVADRFADLGYLTIAPDLYRGAIGGDPGLADDLMRKVDEGRAVAIVKAAIEYLRKLDPPAPRPVALVGFDMGGQLALATALQGANVQGVVIFYGHVATSPERLASLKAEVLAIFAGDDHGIGADEVKKFEETLKAAGKSPKIITYPSVGHSFFDETRPDYDDPLAKDAWVVTRDWLATTLKQVPVPRPSPPGR